MSITVMKGSFQELQQKIIDYPNHKHFENNKFGEELLLELCYAIKNNSGDFSGFTGV